MSIAHYGPYEAHLYLSFLPVLQYPAKKKLCSNIPQADGIRVLVTCWAIWLAKKKGNSQESLSKSFFHNGYDQSAD
jgi:hypothetical protein